jgi:hypothetical protein
LPLPSAVVDDRPDEDKELDRVHGDVPEGLGPEVFREQLRQASKQDPAHGAHITLEKETVFLEDVQSVEAEPEPHKSRVRLRIGAIIGGLTGAAIVAALATVRYRRRRSS